MDYESWILSRGPPEVLEYSEKWGVGSELRRFLGSYSFMVILVFKFMALNRMGCEPTLAG